MGDVNCLVCIHFSLGSKYKVMPEPEIEAGGQFGGLFGSPQTGQLANSNLMAASFISSCQELSEAPCLEMEAIQPDLITQIIGFFSSLFCFALFDTPRLWRRTHGTIHGTTHGRNHGATRAAV